MTDKHLGVRLLTVGTAVRWFGWGLGEAFIPVFLLLFSHSLFETGALASIYNLFFLLSLPIAGYLSDNFKAKKILVASMIMYVFIGLGYFLAGLLTAVGFLIFARALNGVSYSLDQVGREAYIMRHVPKREESRVFGHFDLITNFWWIVAVLVGIYLIKYIPLYWLLFAIVPTTIATLAIFSKLREKPLKKKVKKIQVWKIYSKSISDIRKYNSGLRALAILGLGFGIISSILFFFAPVISYQNGGSIVQSVIIVLAYSIPYLFGDYTGRIADKHKERVYLVGLFLLTVLIIGFIFTQNYYYTLVVMFVASLIFECFYLVNKGVMARITDRTHLGEIDGSLNIIGTIGAIIGPVAFGFLIDKSGLTASYVITAIITVLLLAFAYAKRKKLRGI